ncbi:MAG: cysteine desulfurase-like protein, partial [Thermanaerothrix sp.]|uniref:cysteine desulfurase-like protein n=1 Tax=Thermanaerothrix sp. TaxID=2972675 RepID=UPI003C7A8C78
RPVIYFDNPGGTQITQMALDRMVHYLTLHNANHGGAFATSRESDAVLEMAHQAVADWLNAARADEIVFGANMTTLTLHLSRSIARTWQPGDTIVVTRLDHDANISPWVLAAQDRGCRVRWVDFHPEDGTLDLDDLARALEEKPRLVAVGYASNALGTINPVAKIVRMAHAVGAWVYVDAVQYAAHGPIDVQALGCDFLVCSAYKFFGPHVGVLYGRYDHLQALSAYKVRPAPTDPPGKFETGTQNHEGIAGVLGALEYLEWVGRTFGAAVDQPTLAVYGGRRRTFKQAMLAIQAYEANLSRALLDVLEATPGVTVYGLRDRTRLAERVPTVSFTLAGWSPRAVATALDQAGIYVWDGNFYALAVTERLGLEGKGGLVRVGPVHYNTPDEVQRLGDALARLVRQA